MSKRDRARTGGVITVMEMTTIDDVVARYRRPGPHASVVMRFPPPGQVGDDRMVRWHVRRSELVNAGADDTLLAHLDQLVDNLDPRGETVLLTADHTDATFCWLIDHSVAHAAKVGPCPALLAAVDELSDRAPVIAAVVDHLGADLFELDHLDLSHIGAVQGDQVQTDRHTGGDQAGYQRRAEGVYQRNAEAIATSIVQHAHRAGATLVVLTGDDRETAAVADHLDTHRYEVYTVQAGARHEPQTHDRVRSAAIDASAASRRKRRAAAVAELRETLGQHTLGVEGRDATAAAINEGRVATTFIDRECAPTDADELARTTLAFGGGVVVTAELGVRDGVAAIMRYASAVRDGPPPINANT